MVSKQSLQRLLACLAGGVVLSMMVGSQEGSSSSYSYGFKASVLQPRILVFLAIGLAVFLAISFWPLLAPYIRRAGFWPLVSGGLAVVAGQALMNWFDQIGNGKFGAVADAVSRTVDISWTATAYFGWLAWTQLAVIIALGVTAIVTLRRQLAWLVAALAVVAGVIAVLAHQAVDNSGSKLGADHSLGYAAVALGYLVIAVAMTSTAMTEGQVARGRDFMSTVLGFRPGLPVVALGIVATVLGDVVAVWFSPSNLNLGMSATHDQFVKTKTPIGSLAQDVTSWLGWTMLIVVAVVGLSGVWLRHRAVAGAGVVLGIAASVVSLIAIYQLSDAGAKAGHFDGATGPWQNLGSGGWLTCAGLFLIGCGAALAALDAARPKRPARASAAPDPDSLDGGAFTAPGLAKTIGVIALAAALFYPPMATPFWQQVLVTEIGISLLLAVGLNIVVGWAGLLDLGFIAFYAIGSYTTAYLTDSLPVHPPSWLHLTPLLAIPFAILICLIAGLLLGAPTLRLRGDYLAIVTLGFGEIIRIVAVNANGFTNGSQGPHGVPNPVIHVGPIHIRWGLNQLQYWYLLLVLLAIIVFAFRRLEHSRLGRAWAAVREDEVAAQATGINTTRVKLLAFAIGASTSGIAGVFFATQVGAFTPDNFILNNSILIVAYVVFGGMGSLPGALAGAAMLTWLPRFLQDQIPQSDKLMWIGAVVMLMMIFRPAGLLPARRRRIELEESAFEPTTEPPRALAGIGSPGGSS